MEIVHSGSDNYDNGAAVAFFLLLKYILVIDWEISRQTEKVKSKSFGTISWRSTPNHEILSTITTKATDLQDMIDILPKNLGNITKQKAQ